MLSYHNLIKIYHYFYLVLKSGAVLTKNCLRQIDRLFKRGFKYGYVLKHIFIEDLIRNRDYQLWNKIVEDPRLPVTPCVIYCHQSGSDN